MIRLPAIVRPNGRTYQPRKVTVEPISDGYGDFAAVVFGTHDIEFARPLATEEIASRFDNGYVAGDPTVGWWRDGYEHGDRVWAWDAESGRAGVWFTAVEAPTPPAAVADTAHERTDKP